MDNLLGKSLMCKQGRGIFPHMCKEKWKNIFMGMFWRQIFLKIEFFNQFTNDANFLCVNYSFAAYFTTTKKLQKQFAQKMLFHQIFWNFTVLGASPFIPEIKGVARGKWEIPLRNRKKCCRKMVLFPKALFLVTNFPK